MYLTEGSLFKYSVSEKKLHLDLSLYAKSDEKY